MPHGRIPGTDGENNEPNKHGDTNPRSLSSLNEHVMYGNKFLLIPQLDGPDGMINCKFIRLSQEDGHKFWSYIVTIIYDHEIKVAQDPGYIQFICTSMG